MNIKPPSCLAWEAHLGHLPSLGMYWVYLRAYTPPGYVLGVTYGHIHHLGIQGVPYLTLGYTGCTLPHPKRDKPRRREPGPSLPPVSLLAAVASYVTDYHIVDSYEAQTGLWA